MKKSTSVVGGILAFASLNAFAAPEFTLRQEITRIEYDASADESWIRGAAPWSSAGCPNATWVRIQSSLAGRKQMLALVTAAQMAGKSVTFYGNCDPNTSDIFNAAYVRVE